MGFHTIAQSRTIKHLQNLITGDQGIFMPPFEKGGHIALHLSVGGRYVGRYVGSP